MGKYRPAGQDYVLVNGHPIQPLLGAALTKAFADLGDDAPACKAAICNGWTDGATGASGGTHAHGWAVDFCGVDRLGVEITRRLLPALRKHGIAAVLRMKGDNVGIPQRIQSCHVHAAMVPYSNSPAVEAVTAPGATWCDARQLSRLAAYIEHPW